MKKITIIFLCILCALSGALWFAFKQQWIIIQIPPSLTFTSNTRALEKPIVLSYWHDEQWHTETQNLLCPGTTTQTLHIIVTSWLTHMYQEGIAKKKAVLQSALIDSSSSIAYLSFDRSPLEKEWSTHTKWMFIEGLLKTIQDAHLPIQSIYFLIRHQPLTDPHLDFSHPWPSAGYAHQ